MGLQYGPYRATPHTRVRPASAAYAPRVALDARVVEAFGRIERADAHAAGGALDAATTRRLLADALSRNAYGTASIEGNPLTLDDVASLLAVGPTPGSLAEPDEREILNHAAFLEHLPECPAARTPDDIMALHSHLFEGVLDDAGQFKDKPNFIGKRPEYVVTFVPAMPERVAPELQHALDWLATSDAPPLVRALLFFHEFQSIHPFRDGNGRVGRALLHLQLHEMGYRGVRYAFVDYLFNDDREGYYAALRAGDNGDLDSWLRYGAALLAEAFEDARRRIALGSELAGAYNDRQIHVAEWFARMARGHPERRVKYADVHAAFPHVADRTLKRDLATLRDARIIEAQGRGKGTTYRARG